jgi:hypothetical protein
MMKKLVVALLFALPAVLFGWACFLVFSAPSEPPFDWMRHMSVAEHDALVALLDHQYLVAAYAVTWAIQLGYLAWLGLRWQSQKCAAVGTASPCRKLSSSGA